ncbi:MAG: hypothetical protein K8I60_00740, partial [Anaerolineae bacterium]|nr:hypothetical protein [Anaerolineae bacterium]
MLARVRKLFSPPDLPGDDNTRRIARRLYAVSVLGLIIAVVYAVAWALLVHLYLYRLVFALPLIVLFTTVIVLVRSQHIRAASHVMIGGTWIAVTLIAATAGGTRSPMWGFYTLIVLSAVVFSGWRMAVAYAVLTLLTGIGMVYLAGIGLIAEPFATPISAWITQVSVTAFVALEGYIIVRDVQQALAKSRHELVEREKAEAALRESEERFRLISSVTSDYTFSSRFDAQGNLEHI